MVQCLLCTASAYPMHQTMEGKIMTTLTKDRSCKSGLLVQYKHILWAPPYLAWPRTSLKKVDKSVLKWAEVCKIAAHYPKILLPLWSLQHPRLPLLASLNHPVTPFFFTQILAMYLAPPERSSPQPLHSM